MNTIRFNKQLIGLLIGFFVFVFCLFALFSSSNEQNNRRKIISRDIKYRSDYAKEDYQRKSPDIVIPKKPKEIDGKEVDIYADNPSKNVDGLDKPQNEELKKVDTILEPNDKRVGAIPKLESTSKNSTSNNFSSTEERREKVKEMMKHAWDGYKKYAWGANELSPISKRPNTQGIFGGSQMPATIVDAADTLFIMGLKDEYKDARDYIKDNFSMSKSTSTLSVFETTIRFLGGLLSLFALSGEQFYLEKSEEVAEALLPAFNTPTGIPKSNLNVQSKYATNYGWANGGQSILAEIGSLHLEFLYLSRMTKNPVFEQKVKKVRDVLEEAPKQDGLYSNYINPETGRFSPGRQVSLGALGDSFYEYLIKSYIQTNYTDNQAHRMYWNASEAIQKHMIKVSKKSNLTYTVELFGVQEQHKMGHLACFVPGMFALQAINEDSEEKKEKTMKLAEDLANTCHESYIRSESGIGPEMFYFNLQDEATSRHHENGYIHRPEVIEGWFYLWRLTGKQKYRNWVWDAVQAIDKYCRVESGFAGLQNVYDPSKGYDDVQQSFLLAETFKYAYLTFTDNTVIDLNKWVFNTEAHPLPILEN